LGGDVGLGLAPFHGEVSLAPGDGVELSWGELGAEIAYENSVFALDLIVKSSLEGVGVDGQFLDVAALQLFGQLVLAVEAEFTDFLGVLGQKQNEHEGQAQEQDPAKEAAPELDAAAIGHGPAVFPRGTLGTLLFHKTNPSSNPAHHTVISPFVSTLQIPGHKPPGGK